MPRVRANLPANLLKPILAVAVIQAGLDCLWGRWWV